MTLICPFCKNDLWVEKDEELTECPFCGKRLSEVVDTSHSEEGDAKVDEKEYYKELWQKEKKEKEEEILRHKATSHKWWGFFIAITVIPIFGGRIAAGIGVILLSIGLVGALIKHEKQRKPEERKKSIKQLLWLLVVLIVVLIFIVGVPVLIYQYPEYRQKLALHKRRQLLEEARQWRSEFKSIPISSSVAIELRSVLGNLWFGKTEVTQAQWEALMGVNNPSEFKGPDNPVENVSWDACQEFLRKLNALPSVKASGLTFRLPTEEEWEYACRAGAEGDYCLLADGTKITRDTLGQVAWFGDSVDRKTHPVGQKQPNAFGLYDMHGNVWEWTSTADGGDRVNCGGSWFNSAGSCESSSRNWDSPSTRINFLGFRLCASGKAD